MSAKLPRLNFTKTTINALQPGESRYEVQDSKVSGLYIRVSPTGVKTFYLLRRIAGNLERVKIGRFPAATPEVARQRAEQLNAEITLGKNPAAIKRDARGGVTLAKLFEEYCTKHVTGNGTRLSEQTVRSYHYAFNQYLAPMAKRQASALTKDKLRDIHGALTPARANFLRVLVNSVWAYGKRHGLVAVENPAKDLPPMRVDARDRFIMPEELQSFLAAVERSPYRDYWMVLLLTGARSGNVMAMRWNEIDLNRGVWQTSTSKTGASLRILLVPEVVQILESRRHLSTDWVFPGWKTGKHMTAPKKHWHELLADAGIENLRVHDLRRTLASYQALGGSSLLVIGKSLGHKNQASTAIYARLLDDRSSIGRCRAPVGCIPPLIFPNAKLRRDSGSINMSLKKLAEIRTQIAEVKSSLARLQTASLPMADVEARVSDTVDHWASRFDADYLGRAFASPGEVVTPDEIERACAGEAAKGAIFAAWSDPAGLKAKLLNAARPYAAGKDSIAQDDRPSYQRKMESTLYDLEVEEEKLVSALEADGIEIYRRPDCDPAIALAA